jgi:hypothetical protein
LSWRTSWDNAARCPHTHSAAANQKGQINRTIDESRLSANNPIASGTGPGDDIMSESGGEIISVRRGDFLGIRMVLQQLIPCGHGQNRLSDLLAAISYSTTGMQSTCTNRFELCISSSEDAETRIKRTEI